MPRKTETPAQLAAQRKAFIEAARAAGCSEDEAEFDANLKRVASARPGTAKGHPQPKPS
jgi:hypothetical protein